MTKRARKATAKRSARRKQAQDPREVRPELALPFVQRRAQSARPVQDDYWHIADDGPTDGYAFSDLLLGRRYALLAVKFMSEHAGTCSGQHLLHWILDAMAEQQCLDFSSRSRSNHVAEGFVSQVGELLQFAAKYVRELPVLLPCAPDVPGRAFLVTLPEGTTLVCDPDRPIGHNTRVAITRAGQFLGQGVVETKHPARAKTVIVRMDGVSPPLQMPGDLDRGDIAPIVATQAPGERLERQAA
jgi:hypothetical protein